MIESRELLLCSFCDHTRRDAAGSAHSTEGSYCGCVIECVSVERVSDLLPSDKSQTKRERRPAPPRANWIFEPRAGAAAGGGRAATGKTRRPPPAVGNCAGGAAAQRCAAARRPPRPRPSQFFFSFTASGFALFIANERERDKYTSGTAPPSVYLYSFTKKQRTLQAAILGPII